ncbi:MAG TPA: aldehyde ferredoxin oxidoreductase family protein [Thermodesulfobacteriota bacterium]|nr:aldehyde ferredoxin oxidoreductase family protein [Thermodesulfobacteriota bacterium]
MKAKGYMGGVLWVDLTHGTSEVRPLDDGTAEKYIGGSGLGTRILCDETTPATDPLGPENPLIFSVGPLVGTRIFNSNRYSVVSKSPLTGHYGEANSGGHWGGAFKKCGYDALVVTGASAKPVLLFLDGKRVSIEEAGELWGKDTFQTEANLKKRYGEEVQAALIGQAGENLVRLANVITDAAHGRAAGRCGLGAVMGSKKLKAIVVKGDREVPLAHPEKIKELIKRLGPTMREGANFLQYGTSGGVDYCEDIGNIPVKNWHQGPWKPASKISGQEMSKTILTRRYYCGQCTLGCGRVVKAVGGPYDGMEIGGPEYETVGLLGSNCLVDDLPGIAKSNELCNRFGLDTISTGGVIGFAMEAWERGLVGREDTAGVELVWGSVSAVHAMIEQIAFFRDLGKVLGQGVRRAAEVIGGSAGEFALHVKGLEPPAHDPRAKVTVALGFATANRGACHLAAFTHDFEEALFLQDLGLPQLTDRFAIDGKVENVVRMQHLMGMLDALTVCKFCVFGGLTIQPLVEVINYVTGWSMDTDGFFRAGERIFNLKRMFINHCGLSRKDDMLSARWLTHRRGGGTNFLPPIGELLSRYYQQRGWDEFGVPTAAKLAELGIAGS